MNMLSWIVLGLLAGAFAKVIMPGKQGGGVIGTTLLGVVGAFIGGFVGTRLGWGEVTGFDLRSIGLAVGGAFVLLLGFGMLRGKEA